MSAQKKFYVSFEFPDLTSVKSYQACQIDASNMGMALLRAFQEVRTRDGVKKKQLHRAKISIVEIDTTSSG